MLTMDHAAALAAVTEGQQRMLRDAPSRDWQVDGRTDLPAKPADVALTQLPHPSREGVRGRGKPVPQILLGWALMKRQCAACVIHCMAAGSR